MNFQNLFGSLTTILGIAMVVVGLTAQVRKNFKEKRCGNPLSLAVLAFSVYFSRAIYATIITSYYILIPDVAGVIISLIIIVQYFKYR